MSQNLVQFCCATYLDQVLTQPWTKFWLNRFGILGPFSPFTKDAETTIFIVLSAKNCFFKPTPKIKEHCLWTQLPLTEISFVRFVCMFAFWGLLLCPVFFGGLSWRGMKNTKNSKTIKQKKTKKGSRSTRCKQENHLVMLHKRTTQKQNDTT